MSSKVLEGAQQMARYAETETAVEAWIKDDAPIVIKMTITPELVSKLVDRICGTKTTRI